MTFSSSYVVIAPTDIRPGLSLSVSVNILKATGDVTVQAQLVRTVDSKDISSTQGVFQQGKY